MKKAKLVLASVLGLSLLLGGCSSQKTSSEASDEKGKITLKFFHRWPKEPEKSYFENVAQEFEKQHPNIDIQTEAVLNDSYKEKIRVLLGTNNPPDIYFSWSDQFAYKFVQGNKALDLTPYYKEDTAWSSQLVQNQVTPFSFENKYYGVPWQMDGKSFFYNKDIFDKLNLQPPTTWDEFMKVLAVLKENKYIPIAFGSKATWPISHYIGTLNQRLVDEQIREKDYDPKTGTFTDPGYVEALKKVKELIPYFTENSNSVDHEYARGTFNSGKAGIMYAETAEITLVPDVKNLGLFNFPAIEGQKGDSTYLTGAPEGFMISSKVKHPKEAMEFLKFLTSKEMGEKLVKDVGKYSAVKGTTNETNAAPIQIEAVNQILNAKQMVPWFDTDVDIEIVDAYLTNTQMLLNGEKTPQEVMKEVQKAADALRASKK